MTSTLSLKRSLAVSSNLSPSTAKRPRSDSDISSVSDTASEYSDSCNRTEFQSPRLSSVGYTVSPSWDEPQREHGQELNCDCPDKSDVFSVPTITVDVDEVCIGMIEYNFYITDTGIIQGFQSGEPVSCGILSISSSHTYFNVQPIATDTLQILDTSSQCHGRVIGMTKIPVLRALLDCSLVRIQAVSPKPPVIDFEKATPRSTTQLVKMKIYLNLYSSPKSASKCGAFLGANRIFLQHPEFPDSEIQYRNPHVFSEEFSITTRCESQGGIQTLIAPDKPVDSLVKDVSAVDALQMFGNLDGGEEFEAMAADPRIRTVLMEHQARAMGFFHWRERWTTDVSPAAETVCGGILADSMGLGKSLSAISLIMSTVDACRTRRTGSDPDGQPLGGTLLVAPVSTLKGWIRQMEEHIFPGKLRYLEFHGKSRTKDLSIFCDYDVVITSYHTVSTRRHDDPLKRVHFFRIILDEAHEIRNMSSQKFKAVYALNSKRRWAMTGTPIQNRISDLYALLAFVRSSEVSSFSSRRSCPLQESDGLEKLKTVLRTLCLRRTKNSTQLELPKRLETTVELEFTSEERRIYDHVYGTGSNAITRLKNPLTQLLHLRMVCDHGNDLLPGNSPARETVLTCAYCQQVAEEGCPHRQLCAMCVEAISINFGFQECTACSWDAMNAMDIDSDSQINARSQPSTYRGPSTKVQALIENIISDSKQPDKPKHIVFSVWTRFLDLIEIALTSSQIKFCRLDGAMRPSQREASLRQLSDDPDTTVILLSLQAGGVGINVTAASRVHLMEPHWNPMVEYQAIDRAYRIGQTREVLVRRYIIKDTIEHNMLSLQERKIKQSKDALDSELQQSEKWDMRQEFIAQLKEKAEIE